MKTTLPPLRISPALQKKAQLVLEQGETLSSFVRDAITRSIDFRKARQDFITRGIASGAKAKKTGKYVTAERVLSKLHRRLANSMRGRL